MCPSQVRNSYRTDICSVSTWPDCIALGHSYPTGWRTRWQSFSFVGGEPRTWVKRLVTSLHPISSAGRPRGSHGAGPVRTSTGTGSADPQEERRAVFRSKHGRSEPSVTIIDMIRGAALCRSGLARSRFPRRSAGSMRNQRHPSIHWSCILAGAEVAARLRAGKGGRTPANWEPETPLRF